MALDKVILVTGASSGIGAAIARELAGAGATVVVGYRSGGGEADAIASQIGGRAVQADVSTADGAKQLVEEAGDVDVLVNNAGITRDGVLARMSDEDWDSVLDTNLSSVFYTCRAVTRSMMKKRGGAIVNLSSVHGLLMAADSLIYEAGKSAVIGITRQMAIDFGPRGIRVNAICPGHIVTERIAERTWKDNPSGLRFFEAQYPVRRTGKPVDIANGIVFLCSDEASFITGHALAIDGGLTIQLQEDLACNLAGYYRDHPETEIPYTTAEYE